VRKSMSRPFPIRPALPLENSNDPSLFSIGISGPDHGLKIGEGSPIDYDRVGGNPWSRFVAQPDRNLVKKCASVHKILGKAVAKRMSRDILLSRKVGLLLHKSVYPLYQ